MLFDDLTGLVSEFQRIGTATEKVQIPVSEVYPREETTCKNQMNGALWA